MLDRRTLLSGGAAAFGAALSACSMDGPLTLAPEAGEPHRNFAGRTLATPDYKAIYADYPGEPFAIRAFDYAQINPRWLRQTIEYRGSEPMGVIIVDPASKHLYFTEGEGRATRYGVGVGREGFGWNGRAQVNMKRNWPDWVPPHEMVERQPEIRAQLEQTPRGLGVRGGPKSPLGARAMYLFSEGGGHDLGYRIHGTTEPETIGTNVSSGCIRMVNQDIVHLYTRASVKTRVIVLA
ncbi:MAG: L,D-transpeptidase [Methylobacteriaceae bacterium]|nr:L,D-transpeptidase [Methylobacteriaceae bacterium]